MNSSQEAFGSVGLVDSMDAVEFDADREVFRAAFDSSRDTASVAVVAVVATALGSDPLDLTPLQSAVETDTLEELATESASRGGRDCVSFCYEGFVVTVSDECVIEAAPIEITSATYR